MPGVPWSDRQPTDWLASNGRWYPASKYPRGWTATALPPAPGQGGIGSILRKYASQAVEMAGLDGLDGRSGVPAFDEDGFPHLDGDPTATPSPPQEGFGQQRSSPRPPPRRKSPAGRPPTATSSQAPGFSVARSGRSVANATVTEKSNYAHKVGAGAPPPPQLPQEATRPGSPPERVSNVPALRPPPSETAAPASSFEVVAGDLGKVLGGAKKRIEKAINDSIDGQSSR